VSDPRALLSRLRAYLQLMRVFGPLIMGFSVVLGEIVALGRAPSLGQMTQGFLVMFCLGGAAFVINDYMDLEGDRTNYPGRPLPRGAISTRSALVLGIALSTVGLLIALWTNARAFILAVVFLAMAMYYDVSGKLTGLPGNLIVAFCSALTFMFGAALVSRSFSAVVTLIFLLAFLANGGREISKSIADQEGDRIGQVRSIALLHGARTAAILGAAFFLLTASLGPIIYLRVFGNLGGPQGSLILVAESGFVFISFWLIRRPDEQTAARAAAAADVFMVIVVVMLLLVSLM